MNNQTPALAIDNLSYTYRTNWTFTPVRALKPFSLNVAPGECFGFLGHNGAGKTTSIKCILGLTKPSSGSIKIFGIDSHNPLSRKEVGYLPEQPYFYDNLTVSEIMHLYATLAGVPSSEINSKVKNAIDRVGLGFKAKASMRALSKGLMQRVALAQAIVHEPKLLILDEPFSGLDPIGRKEFRDILFTLRDSGTTFFMSSHVLSDVEALCDRVSVLVRGELQGVFDIKDVPRLAGCSYELCVRSFETCKDTLAALSDKAEQHHDFLELKFNTQEKAVSALKLALEHNCQIESYQFSEGSLEQLFVKLVHSAGGAIPRD